MTEQLTEQRIQEEIVASQIQYMIDIATYKFKYGVAPFIELIGWSCLFYDNFVGNIIGDNKRAFLMTDELKDTCPINSTKDGNSEIFLRGTHTQFYGNVDQTARECCLDIGGIREIHESTGNAPIYAMPAVKKAYVTLRLLGYNHTDLTR